MNEERQEIQTAIRLSKSLLKRIDKHAEHLSKAGIHITRAEVHRLAVEHGIAKLEADRKKR